MNFSCAAIPRLFNNQWQTSVITGQVVINGSSRLPKILTASA